MTTLVLRVTGGPATGTDLTVDGELILGRERGDGIGGDPELSRRHARLIATPDGGLSIEDLGSTNGTTVNDRRINVTTPLAPGDVVELGKTRATVVSKAPAATAEPVAAPQVTAMTRIPVEAQAATTSVAPFAANVSPLASRSAAGHRSLAGLRERAALFLRRTTLLRGASPELLDQVAAALRPQAMRAGEVITEENAPAERFFLVQSGTVAISVDAGTTEREIARIGAGEFFGESALISGTSRLPRTRALTDGTLLTLTPARFHELAKGSPELAEVTARIIHQHDALGLRTAFELDERNIATLLERHHKLTLGRSAENDLVFDSPGVSRQHALIRQSGGECRLTDLGSSSGTYVNGAYVRGSVTIRDGDHIVLGDESFVFDRRRAVKVASSGGIRIDANGLRKEIPGNRTLLQDVSLTILPGEFVAIVGGSGAGKSTLMDALSGVRPASGGQVLYDGRDFYKEIDQYRHTLGFVPQDDVLHLDMSLRLTLRYGARLRLPRGTTDAVIDAAVDEAISQLGLEERRDVRVGLLSGGQRKRASIGLELLTQPRVFFLDEPTSGLDPATDGQMMRLLREVADGGRTVVLTTHATRNVTLCDRVVVLARNGHLAFVGPPAEALTYFGVDGFDEIYDRLEAGGTPEDWGHRFRLSEDYTRYEAERATPVDPAAASGAVALGRGSSRGLPQGLHQFRVLSARQWSIYLRNKPNVMPIILMPIVLTLLCLALFGQNLFTPEANPTASFQLIYTMSFTAFLFGLLFGAQEFVKERAIFLRERGVGIGVLPYMLSKTSFLAPALMLAGGTMTGLLWATNRLPDEGFDFYLRMLVTMWLTAWAGMAMSLLISAIARTPQNATDLLTPVIGPQVLFAGALFAVPSMGAVGQFFAEITGVRWSFEALVQMTDIKEIWAENGQGLSAALGEEYATSFNYTLVHYWWILVIFIVVPLVFCYGSLRRRTVPN